LLCCFVVKNRKISSLSPHTAFFLSPRKIV
jgi:hypothetical protein